MAGRPATKPAPPFGERLAALRKERGWTQPQLAERLNATVKMVTYLERQAKNPTAKTIEQIARVFGVPVNALIGSAKISSGARKPGPPSQLEQRVSAVRQLPRNKQKTVLQLLDAFLRDAPDKKS
ncbi:MAG: helix-turn-helix domain-containing protein [Limisphaerales bacterium]